MNDNNSDNNSSIDTATGEQAPSNISTDRVYKVFSSIAKRYERFNAISSFGMYRHWLNTMVSLTPINSDSVVLDVAGGTGDVSFAIAKKKSPAKKACCDLVPEMLDIAKQHAKQDKNKHGVPMDFVIVDAQNMPFDDCSFDVVTMAYGIRNMPKRQLALSEILRVLRPGGCLVCLEFSTPTNPIWRSLYNFYRDHMIPLWGKIITGQKDGFVYLGKSIKTFPNQEEFTYMLQKCGFEKVEWVNCSGGIAAVHTGIKPNPNSCHP